MRLAFVALLPRDIFECSRSCGMCSVRWRTQARCVRLKARVHCAVAR
ncbi:hypothetical protein XCR_4108 [Xanthomonas campestris pv. raphani 756C]|nr:hypothetical protein XCR_4108 [Xanthomonas campestris pv. raphani 756C]